MDCGNLPADGTPLLIASNHQNCLNDPLAILFASMKRKPYFLTRADAFKLPFAEKFFYFIGLLPSYRLGFDGEESLKNNQHTFTVAQTYLLNGATIVIFPEAAHQDKHWLGDFSFGYTRLAFEAAEADGFQTNIYIIPACNHYSDYFRIREEVLIKYGTPIPLHPYYELYKSKPRTAQRQVSDRVRQQIADMMLNITDLDHYREIYFLLNHFRWCRPGGSPTERLTLPQKLVIDKAFVAALETQATQNPHKTAQLYQFAQTFEQMCQKHGIKGIYFHQHINVKTLLFQFWGCVMAFPVWIATLFPAVLMYSIPKLCKKRMPDSMFVSTFRFAITVLFTLPIFYGAITVFLWVLTRWWIALAVLVALPFAGILAWNYYRYLKNVIGKWKFWTLKRSTWKTMKELDSQICQIITEIL